MHNNITPYQIKRYKNMQHKIELDSMVTRGKEMSNSKRRSGKYRVYAKQVLTLTINSILSIINYIYYLVFLVCHACCSARGDVPVRASFALVVRTVSCVVSVLCRACPRVVCTLSCCFTCHKFISLRISLLIKLFI